MIARNIRLHSSLFKASSNTWKLWQFTTRHCRNLTIILALSAASALAACGAIPSVRLEVGEPTPAPTKFTSFVVADEPQAVLVARDVLLSGGNAVDAAVVLGFSLAVTLPSSAGLGGNGACVVHDFSVEPAETLDFLTSGALLFAPRLARGLFSLHSKHGSLPWPQVVSPAENLARFGHLVSLALAQDLDNFGSRLVNDRAALDLFMTPQRHMLRVGDRFLQPQLASALSGIRTRFPNNFGSSTFDNEVVQSIATALNLELPDVLDLPIPNWKSLPALDDQYMKLFLYQPESLRANGSVQISKSTEAEARLLSSSTTFIVADSQGKTVACMLTMGEPFGLGIMPRGLGFLIASGAPGDSSGVASFAIAFLADLRMEYMMLAAASSGTDAARKVMYEVGKVKSGTGVTDAFADQDTAGAHSQEEINIVHCKKNRFTDYVQCQALTRSSGYGHALVFDPGT